MVTLRLKWPGISKIFPPILDYRMFSVLSNNHLVFDSSQGTPCSSDLDFVQSSGSSFDKCESESAGLTQIRITPPEG